MKIVKNAISSSLCDSIRDIALAVATTPGGVVIKDPASMKEESLQCWMNYGWEDSLVIDSTPVFCVKLPKFIITKVQEELHKVGVYDPLTDLSFEENSWLGCMAYVWTYDSYIALHHDSKRKTVTVYLNRDWEYSEGGHFNWYDDGNQEWKMVVPSFNTMITNNGGIPHATTPVKSRKQFRVSLQAFFMPR